MSRVQSVVMAKTVGWSCSTFEGGRRSKDEACSNQRSPNRG